jgi:hypothetical protein
MSVPATTADPVTTPARVRPVLYPFLIGLYPILYLYARNARSIPAGDLLVPVGIVVAVLLAGWGILTLAVRDAHRAGLLAALTFALFATIENASGIVKYAVEELSRLWVYRTRQIWSPPVVAGELVLFAYLVYRAGKLEPGTVRKLTWPLNVLALLLVAQPAIQAISIRSQVSDPPGQVPGPLPALATSQVDRPDIYYIILDSFARPDVMAGVFHYDMGPVLARLEARGFYLARRSTANYCRTRLSLAASLNLDYLHPAADEETQMPPQAFFSDNALLAALRPLGYRFISFATGFDYTDDPGEGVRLSPYREVNGFARLLLESTPFARWLPNPMERDSYTMTRERTLFVFDRLPEVARWPGPKFTFAHLLVPHPPFVFGEYGEDVSPHQVRYYLSDGDLYQTYYGDGGESFVAHYRAQAKFVVERVARTIEAILANSAKPPIIIIQSDHGSGLNYHLDSLEGTDLWERMSIFNAYYLPGDRREGLHEQITPVNSFRVVLNNYFGARLPLLPDEGYFSAEGTYQRFVRVTDRVAKRPGVQ